MGRIVNTSTKNTSSIPTSTSPAPSQGLGRIGRQKASPAPAEAPTPAPAAPVEIPAVVANRHNQFIDSGNRDKSGLFGGLFQTKKQPVTPESQAQFDQFAKQAKEGGEFLGSAALAIPRALPRAIVSLGETAREIGGVKGASFTPGEDTSSPVGKAVEKVIYGDQPIKGIGGKGKKTSEDISSVGVNKTVAKIAGYPLAVAGTALDLIPGVGGEKKVGEEALAKVFAKTADEAVVQSVLKGQKFSDEVIADIAPKIAKSSNADEIKSIISSASNDPKNFNAEKYVAEETARREAERKAANPGIIDKGKTFLNTVKAKLVDFTAPIEDTLYNATKASGITLKPEEDIHNQIDRVLRSPSLAGQFAKDNGIVDLIKNVDNVDNLDQYLTARQSIDIDTRGLETGRDLKKDEALVKAFRDKYEPQAQIVNGYSQKLLDYTADSGLISKDTADFLKRKYPNYVPFNRVFNEIEKATEFHGTKGVASLSGQNIVQQIKGSTRAVESPLESLLAKTHDAFKEGEKNLAGKMLAGYKDLPGNPFKLRELESGETAKNTISFLDNGVKKTFETTPEIATAAKALNVQQLGVIGRILSAPVRVARLGITGINPAFIAANFSKDQVSGFINADKALATSVANPGNFVKSLMSAVRHDELYDELVRAGGAGTSFDISRNVPGQTIERIRSGKDAVSKIKYLVKNPSELLRAAEDIVARTEEATRLQHYRGTKNALLKEGMDEKNAIIGGARSAREDTVNFARRGEWGTVLNSMFLYLNANIQGTRTLVRSLKNSPLETSSKIALSVLFPQAVATAWNVSSPDRKAAYADIPEYEKRTNMIVIPPNPTKDANGKWNVIKIPLSSEINGLASLTRRPIEAMSGLDPIRFKDFAEATIGTVSPVGTDKNSFFSTATPQIIKPSIESLTNHNIFTGFPVVPDSMKNLSPENQVRDNTSGSARKIGKLLKVSPIKVEDWIKETFGGAGAQAENAVDHILASTGAIPKDQVGGINILDAVTSRFSKASGGQTSQDVIDEVSKTLTKQADIAYVANKNAEKKWAELKALPPDQAKTQFEQLVKGNPLLAKNVAKIGEQEKLGLDYSDRLVNQLQVKNGARAKYIQNKIQSLDTKEEKAALWQDYVSKKIITKEVAKQIADLLNKK